MRNKDRKFICKTCNSQFTIKYNLSKNQIPEYCNRLCWSKREILDSTRKKQSEVKKGKTTWNKGINMWKDREHPRGTLGKINKMKGKSLPEEWKRNLSESHKGKILENQRDEKHWNWKGGIANKRQKEHSRTEYKSWRRSVFERDNYTCQECKKRGGTLNAHHIKPYSEYKELRYDINNGLTLCLKCHLKTDSFGGRMNKVA